MKEPTDFSPAKRYGHSAVIYEPATSQMLAKLKSNLRLADINQRMSARTADGAAQSDDSTVEDTSFMIVFGGKNAISDVLFNDIYFLGIP